MLIFVYLSIYPSSTFIFMLFTLSPALQARSLRTLFPDTFAFGSGYNLHSVNEIISCKILKVKYRLNETIYEKNKNSFAITNNNFPNLLVL